MGAVGIGRHASTRPRGLVTALWWLALAAICLNALAFAVKAANPLVVADGWHFLDAIVMPYAHGDLAFGDLFLKRGAMDHSQPLRKLILLMHYEWFDLDYSVEAVIGACAGIANLAILGALVVASSGRGLSMPAARGIGFLALAAAYLSLNASVVFSWPLLTLNYTSHAFLLAHFAAAWWALRGADGWRRAAVVAATGFVLGVVADDTGTIAALALAIAAGLHGWRTRTLRRAGVVTAAGLAGQAAYLLFYAWVAPPVGGSVAIRDLVPALAGRIGEWWQWLAVPLSASVAHRSQLEAWLGDASGWLPSVIAVVLLAAHLWFWWQAFAGRRNAAAFVATCQMLLFYGLLAGMLLARVSQHGSDYLWQPRYVLIYQWNLVALLLMALAQLAPAPRVAGAGTRRGGATAMLVVAALVLAVQVPLSLQSWQVLPYAKRFQQRQAMQMRQLAAGQVPRRCVHTLVVCRHPEARRAELMGFLRDQQLSVFAPGFADRHPMLATDPGDKPRARPNR